MARASQCQKLPGEAMGRAGAAWRLVFRAWAAFTFVFAFVSAAHAQPGSDDGLRLRLPTESSEGRSRNVGRAALETAGLILGAGIWYWSDLEFNSRDWDLKWDWPSWKSKLTLKAVRFDQNLFDTNAGSHTRAGAMHYQIARGNGLGAATSVATAFGTSVLWEYLVEFKEMPSLNDIIVNTTSGFSIGEPFYQLGDFLLEGDPTWLARGVAAVVSPVASFNEWIADRPRPRGPVDGLGLSRQRPHWFQIGAGIDSRRFAGTVAQTGSTLGLGAAIVTLRGYGRAETFATWAPAGSFSEINAVLNLAGHGVTGGSVHTEASIFGRYWQTFRFVEGERRGHGVFVGLGSAFDYVDVGRPDGSDYFAAMNIAGPMAQVNGAYGDFNVGWKARVYGDFAMVRSLAMVGHLDSLTGDQPGAIYKPAEHGSNLPSVVGARGYYYALGLTADTELAVGFRAFDAGVGWRADRFDSIPGFDRFRDQLQHETDLTDAWTTARAWLGVRPWPAGPRLASAYERLGRRGTADDLAAGYADTRLGMNLSLIF
jgi:hypothetical protein